MCRQDSSRSQSKPTKFHVKTWHSRVMLLTELINTVAYKHCHSKIYNTIKYTVLMPLVNILSQDMQQNQMSCKNHTNTCHTVIKHWTVDWRWPSLNQSLNHTLYFTMQARLKYKSFACHFLISFYFMLYCWKVTAGLTILTLSNGSIQSLRLSQFVAECAYRAESDPAQMLVSSTELPLPFTFTSFIQYHTTLTQTFWQTVTMRLATFQHHSQPHDDKLTFSLTNRASSSSRLRMSMNIICSMSAKTTYKKWS